MNEKDLLKEAMENFNNALAIESENREDALISSRFADGDQWPEEIRIQRMNENRPCLTINKLRKFISNISGEIQQNRPSVEVRPVNGGANVAGAILRNDIIKYIEDNSKSYIAYDTAVQQALEGGYGYYRIITSYSDNNSFNQDILIKAIPNRFSVVLDQQAEGKVYEDARFGFVMNKINKSDFKKTYKNAEMVSFDAPDGNYDWLDDDQIRIAEYFWKEKIEEKIYLLDDGNILDTKTFNLLKDSNNIESIANRITRERTIYKDIVKWAKLTQNAIFEGPLVFPGSYIPIIPVIGYEYNDEGRRRFRSLIHDAIDPMRMFNYWKTYATEMIALSPKAPYKITPQQIEGNEDQWNVANISPQPYLLYNHIQGIPLPSREPPVPIPAAAVNEANMSAQDIQDVIGMYAPSIGEPSNERSGRAILARQRQSNNTIFTFINNFQSSLIHTGKILLEMIPEIYDTERVLQIVGKEGMKELKINFPTVNLDEMIEYMENDLTYGKYDMIPTVGPNFQTKRMQTAASMLDFLQFVPMSAPIIAPKLATLMDWEGAQTIGEEMSSLLQSQMQPKPPVGSNAVPTDTEILQQQ